MEWLFGISSVFGANGRIRTADVGFLGRSGQSIAELPAVANFCAMCVIDV